MKKSLYLFIFLALFLSGCEKNSSSTPPESLFRISNGETYAGVKSGDGPAAFQKAYGSYTIQVGYDEPDSSLNTMSIHEIPYDEDIYTIISGFFIDGKPVAEETICSDNQIEVSGLHDLLSSSDYLRSHEVIYRYLIFTWSDGIITDIDSEELNYNETFEVPCLE